MFALLLAACSSAPRPTSGDLAAGGGGGDLGFTGPRDMTPRSIVGIACGANSCTTTLELCCTADNGKSGDCQKVQTQSCGSSVFQCDGPEDCEPANPECCVQGGLAACRTRGFCATQTSARLMCHADADCGAGGHCCPAPASPYALCLATCP